MSTTTQPMLHGPRGRYVWALGLDGALLAAAAVAGVPDRTDFSDDTQAARPDLQRTAS